MQSETAERSVCFKVGQNHAALRGGTSGEPCCAVRFLQELPALLSGVLPCSRLRSPYTGDRGCAIFVLDATGNSESLTGVAAAVAGLWRF